MSKKDYVAIAAIIREAHNTFSDHAPIHYIQRHIADYFASQNPKFDRARFNDAAGFWVSTS